jgi:hypothetical protein
VSQQVAAPQKEQVRAQGIFSPGRPAGNGHALLQLQRQYGNRHVQRVLAQTKTGKGQTGVAPGVEGAIQRSRGRGQALDSGVRAQMEPALGADFGGVRVHTDGQADRLNRALNAQAFTSGQDIYFRQGAYNPNGSGGRELLAHELTHVVQQSKDQVQRKMALDQPGGRHEQEADQAAWAATHQPQQPTRKGTDKGLLQRQAMHNLVQKRGSRSRYVRKRVLSGKKVRKLQSMLNQTISKLGDLERAILLTSDERDELASKLTKLSSQIGVLGEKRRYPADRYRYLRKYRRKFVRAVEKRYKYTNLRKNLKKRKRVLKKDGKIVSDLKTRPRVIRIHKGEAFHISFNLKKPIKDGYVLVTETRSEGHTRILPLKGKKLGYNYVIWTGFWGLSNPASTGTYWMNLVATDDKGRSENLWTLLRVENKAQNLSVGLVPDIKHMRFDGKQLVVEDAKGNTMSLQAVSGIKKSHKLYKKCKKRYRHLYRGSKPDFTKSKFQWAEDCGPLPEREYTLNVRSVVPPETTGKGRLEHPRQQGGSVATVEVWGPWRFRLDPNVIKEGNIMRSGFFLHLDTKGDGTAGCIGVQPGDEGKLNMLYSLIRRMKGGTIKITVKY